jgi:2-polyprenyl-3-methyl-5-hydroxy-6-metoxy-1,4-benzoquinol methylase
MYFLRQFLSEEIIALLTESELHYLKHIFSFYSGLPPLRDLWALLDQAWHDSGCHEFSSSVTLASFYSHPVWLLNGIYSEHDIISLSHRNLLADYIASLHPTRVLDVGGGFGALSRSLGLRLPSTEIDIYEPFPHPAAEYMAQLTSNVRYIETINRTYDIIIATDVYEHLQEPLGFLEFTLTHLKSGGQYVFSNCFHPVIQCHLSRNNHFNASWSDVVNLYGLRRAGNLSYGQAFIYSGPTFPIKIKQLVFLSSFAYLISSWLPRGSYLLNKAIYKALITFFTPY